MSGIVVKKPKNAGVVRQVAQGSFAYQKRDLTPDAERCHVSYYEIPPGKSNYPFHCHLNVEESFYILRGRGALKTIEGEIPVEAGDFVFFPAGEQGAHRLTNTSNSQPLAYLDFDTVCAYDVCLYPDSEKVAVLGKGIRQIYRLNSQVDYYDGEV